MATTILACLATLVVVRGAPAETWRLSTFAADVTIPLNHRCMGVLPTKSKSIADPLEARGLMLSGGGEPIVLLAVDWCEIRNGAYDQWRDALAKAAGCGRERVLVCALHQHDAPVTDSDAGALLAAVGLRGELYDEQFHAQCIQRVVDALKRSLPDSQPVTHFGVGQAEVRRIASNRRMVRADGRVAFDRGSRSGSNPRHREAPEGEIDPLLKTLSFWNGERPLAALSVYATHPMSYYGRGEVSADFVGLARRRRQQDLPEVFQIYASGCSGDVTAGKFNDGSAASRVALTDRLHDAMRRAWESTKRSPLTQVDFRSAKLRLPYHSSPSLSEKALDRQLRDPQARTEDRILAAMGLASRRRVERPIDFPCLDLGTAKLLLFPGESFVGYQLMAQSLAPDAAVLSIGYGECWPGYIPTAAAFADDFRDKWLWAGRGSEREIRRALQQLLRPAAQRK